jgi:predicted solute-binding protein
MTQLTIQPGTARLTAPATARRRTMRHTRMVSLRTPMPLGLVTVRHDVPEWLGHDVPDLETEKTEKSEQKNPNTTSKVVLAPREVETTARRAQ